MHRLTEFSLRRPWFMGAVLLAITAGLAAGIPDIQPGYGYRILLGDHHPAVQNLDAMIEEYAGGSPIRIAWECGENHPCRTALDEASLHMAARVSRQLKLLPAVRAVQGPADTALLVPVPDGFAVRYFLENGQVPADAEALAERALKDRFWRNTLVSSDGSVGVILVQTTDNRPQTMVEVVDAIDSTLEIPRETGFVFFMVGDAPGSVLGGRSLAESTDRLIPFLVGLTGIVIFSFVRSWQQTLASLLNTGLALLWALGVLGWLGWPQDGMLEVLAPLILVLGVCDSMHLLVRYSAERGAGLKSDVTSALRSATQDVAPACLVTTLTTAAAFLSFTTSALDTFARFGVIAACGVVACLVLSFSLVPMLLQWLPDDVQRTSGLSSSWKAVMDAVTRTTVKRANTILLSSGFLLLLSAVGWSQLRVDQHWIEAYGERNQFVQSAHFMETRMGLSQTLEVEITLPVGVRLEDQSTLHLINEFSGRVTETPELTKATSVLDLIERMNRLLHDDDPAYERIGETTAANAEILEILGFDDPETLGRWISLDRSQLRISLDSLDLAHRQREKILNQVRTIAENDLPADWNVSLSGEFAITHDWVRDVQATQLRSFPTAFAIVFVLVSVFLRSWKLGLAAMVPTLLPVVVILGLMGWAGLTLDVARAMIAAVVIGIGVDDAVHILAHYKVRRSRGADPRAAMQAALRHTGRAVVTTSAALALGFLTLMMSAWQTIASFGFLVSIAILGALAASLFVLPALIFAFAPAGETARRPANPRIPVHSPGEVR